MKLPALCRLSVVMALSLIFMLPIFSHASNRLDELQQQLTINGESFIESYTINGGSAYIKLNSNIWNKLATREQRQICDTLANTDVWKKIPVINAWLSVGSTQIGRIKPNMSGGFEFLPK